MVVSIAGIILGTYPYIRGVFFGVFRAMFSEKNVFKTF